MSLGSATATSSDQPSPTDKDELSQRFKLSLLLTPTPELKAAQRQARSHPALNEDIIITPSPSLLMNPSRLRSIEICETFKNAVFIFGDMKDSTLLGQKITSKQFAELLEPIFTKFQDFVIQYGEAFGIYVVKLKGDGIMIAGASHEEEETHKQVQMMLYISHLMAHFMSTRNTQKAESDFEINFRFGVHMGEATKMLTRVKQESGVIEQIDWYGDAANKASRMESSSHPNQVQISEEIHKIAENHFDCTTPKERDIKSYGATFTRFLIRPTKAFLGELGKLRLDRKASGSFSTELPRKGLGSPRSSSANQ
jgi:class 3 adenylate cyclase